MQTKNMQTIANAGSGDGASGDGFLTRPGLAAALQVSVCTVDRMADNGEIPRVRVRRRVRFYLADVMEALRKGSRKFGRAAELTAEAAKSAENTKQGIHLTQPSPQSGEGAAVTRRNGGAA
jgi:excisionase family DNA binding protein